MHNLSPIYVYYNIWYKKIIWKFFRWYNDAIIQINSNWTHSISIEIAQYIWVSNDSAVLKVPYEKNTGESRSPISFPFWEKGANRGKF